MTFFKLFNKQKERKKAVQMVKSEDAVSSATQVDEERSVAVQDTTVVEEPVAGQRSKVEEPDAVTATAENKSLGDMIHESILYVGGMVSDGVEDVLEAIQLVSSMTKK